MEIVSPEKKISILAGGDEAIDLVIAGASLAGIGAALSLAARGRKILLVEPRTYPGLELTAHLRPWLSSQSPADQKLLKLLASALPQPASQMRSGEIPLQLDRLKIALEDLLLAAGVKLLYASQPVGLTWKNGRINGLVVGNKSGRQLLRGSLFIDATETALLARLAGYRLSTVANPGWSRSMEFDRVDPALAGSLTLPEEMDVEGNTAVLHVGFSPGSAILACNFDLPWSADSLSALSRIETNTRERLMRVAAWLKQNHVGFKDAIVGEIAPEPRGRYCQLETPADWLDISNIPPDSAGLLAGFATPNPALWLLSPAARLADPETMTHPGPAFSLGESLARHLQQNWNAIQAATAAQTPLQSIPQTKTAGELMIREPDSPQRGRNYPLESVAAGSIPVVENVDVLVVGGGSSGALAAYAAAQSKANTVLVEMLPGLGGTGTFGGVNSYWFGNRSGFAARVRRWVNREHKALGLAPMRGEVPRWNISAKSYTLEKNLLRAGVALHYNTIVTGAILDDQAEIPAVRGIIAATRLGPVAILAQVVIDASGDGDIASFAGAQSTYGSARDRMAMWYSLAQFSKPGVTRNNFTSSVDVSNIEDYNRALVSGRRRGLPSGKHNHGIYLAPRESRHIQGEITLELSDQLLKRAWEDVICITFSNNDIKGQISSEWFRLGLIPPNLEVEIPLRALIPNNLENILVVGKAFSISHDALPASRMQADLENLGGSAGLAAALAIQTSKSLRNLDLKNLQRQLVEHKVLPATVLTRERIPFMLSASELSSLIRSLASQKPLHTYSDMSLTAKFAGRIPVVDIISSGPKSLPPLLEAFKREKDPNARLLLAQMLSLMGSQAGVPALAETIFQLTAGGTLPGRDFAVRHTVKFAPDQAAMPYTANLLFSLAEARDLRAIPVWERVVDLLAQIRPADVFDQQKGVFYYVDSVCVGAEKLGSPKAIPLLLRLHQTPALRDHQLLSGFQVEFLPERAAYLELVIGRALARCGAAEGVIILVNYLQDVRALLAEQAHQELIAISDQDFGKDPSAWSQWLEQHDGALRPTPWNAPSDAQSAWGKAIFIQAED